MVVVVRRASFIHGWAPHFCPLGKGRRKLVKWRKDNYDVEMRETWAVRRVAFR